MTANAPTPTPAPTCPGPTHRRRVQVGAALAAIPLVVVLAACGNSPAAPAAASAPATPEPTATQGFAQGSNVGGSGGAPTFPGAIGLIAAVSPGTLQVQSSTAQNTVVYTSVTKFIAVTSGHLVVGDCVMVNGAQAAGSAKELTATSVRIDAKVNGACCAPGAGGGFGGGSARHPYGMPGGGSAARLSFVSATGSVSSVSGSTILVSGVLRSGPGRTGSAVPLSPSIITVSLGSSATVTQTVSATSSAAVVGQCARAIGSANSVGTITERSITISKPGPNGCNTGFGGRGDNTAADSTGSAAGSNA
jgi:hypothetical protein